MTGHHEMVGPLKIIVELCEMVRELYIDKNSPPQVVKTIKTILISTKLVLFHSNDLLDQRIIQNGSFVPSY